MNYLAVMKEYMILTFYIVNLYKNYLKTYTFFNTVYLTTGYM